MQQEAEIGATGEELLREPTEFGRYVLSHLERRGQSMRGLARASGVSFDRLKALLYGRYVPAGQAPHALGSTFLLSGLYKMADYLGVSACELMTAFYGRDRETEARLSCLFDGFLRLDDQRQDVLLSVVESLLPGGAAPLSQEACDRLSSLSLGRSQVIHSSTTTTSTEER